MDRLAILTSGGDSPGMNSTIVAITNHAIFEKCQVFYIQDGYKGLYDDRIIESINYDYNSYFDRGGTFIGSSRFPEFTQKKNLERAVANLKSRNINKLIVIGGDGTYKGALLLTKYGIICGALPGTIDNDVVSTNYSIGFDTALNTAVNSIRKLKDTMQSHKMCCIVELMGRHCSDLAVYAGIATNADLIITNENKMSPIKIANIMSKSYKRNKKGMIIVISEHIYDVKELAKFIQLNANINTRACVLGHTQRGGSPSAMEAYRASLMGWKAYNELKKAKNSFAIGWKNNEPTVFSIDEALKFKNACHTNTIAFYNKINSKI